MAPIVASMAMSARLSETSMVCAATMLNAAMATTSASKANISAFSSFTASNKSPWTSAQVRKVHCAGKRSAKSAAALGAAIGSAN